MRKTPRVLTPASRRAIIQRYQAAKHRLLFLDYDGTLWPTGLDERSPQAKAEHALVRSVIRRLTQRTQTTVVIVSGRDHTVLAQRFKGLGCALAAEHGLWLKEAKQSSWMMVEQIDTAWKIPARVLFQQAMHAIPTTWFEEKPYSLVWHYRNVPARLVKAKVKIMRRALQQLTKQYPLRLIMGRNLIELLPASINKGRATKHWLCQYQDSFIIAAGDERTDEDIFSVLPRNAISIKVQAGSSLAKYLLPDDQALRDLLAQLADRKTRL
ncbi:MAG: trehalose-phosphatase [Candidatus Kerfeldbacteria bacterium]|nr:trehalose-phosphatase [Candidatus Kerfeldbacteria bacterium]